MKIILIPIDFSKESEKALSVGATIARRISAKLVLTHMVDLDERSLTKNPSDNFAQKLFQSKLAAKNFDEFLEKDFLDGIVVDTLLQNHIDFKGISELANELSADLIVMGSSGSKGLMEITKGSNTEKVVRSSNVPVLVVKKNELKFSSETILFVSDFNEESIDAYNRISEFAQMLNAKMNCLYINLPGTAFKSTKEMDEILFKFFTKAGHKSPLEGIKSVNRYADYSIEKGIYNFSNLSTTDIIAIPTHGRKGLSHLLNGSISEDVANHSIIPVLTLRI